MTERFKIDIEDVPAVMRALPRTLQGPGKGLTYDDGDLVVNDEVAAGQVRKAMDNIDHGRVLHLRSYAADLAARRIAEGVVTVNGQRYATSYQSLLCIMAAWLAPSQHAVDCKTLDGFVKLDTAGLKEVHDAIVAFEADCVAIEAALHDKIISGAVTTTEIDQAFR